MARLLVGLYPCDITDDITDIDAALAAIQSTVDDIETDVGTVDTVVDGIAADVVVIDGLVDTLTVNMATANVVVAAIKVMTDAMAVLTETGGTVTTDGTEQDVYINNAPDGVYKPICVKINTTNHTATETIVIRKYSRNASGGAWLEDDELEFAGVITQDQIIVDLEPNRYGIKVTIEKTDGTNRAYGWEVFYSA